MARSQRTSTIHLGFDHHNWVGAALARTLWLQGHPAQAVERARQTVNDAARMDHPVTHRVELGSFAALRLGRVKRRSARNTP